MKFSFLPNLKLLKKYQNYFSLLGVLLIFVVIPLTVILSQKGEEVTKNPKAATTRDPKLWPFPSNSIWNLPLGANATYKALTITQPQTYSFDEDMIIMSPTSPLRDVYTNGAWPGNCNLTTKQPFQVPIPDGYVVPQVAVGFHMNYPGAVLMPDGQTIKQGQPLTRCSGTGPVTLMKVVNDDNIVTGDGIYGGHGGSDLSSLGGAVRKGELTSSNQIQHALKLTLNCNRHCSKSNGGFQWPARKADDYALLATGYGTVAGGIYSNAGLGMGSLVALAPTLDINALGLTSVAAKKVAWTLQNYGAYIADDAYDDGTAAHPNSELLAVERGVDTELNAATGLNMESSSGVWYDDMNKIWTKLSQVTNWNQSLYNSVKASAGTQGAGGGAPKVAWAPDLVSTGTPFNSVDQVIATRGDHALPHDINLPSPINTWSWGTRGTEDTKYKYPDSGSVAPWLVVFRDASVINTATPVRFNVRRLALYNYQPSNSAWVKLFDGLPQWRVSSNPDTTSGYTDIIPIVESDGSYSFPMTAGRVLHMASTSWPTITEGNGTLAIVEARVLGSASDIAAAKMATAPGADYRAAGGDFSQGMNTPGYHAASFGHFGLLTGDWKSYDILSSTLTDAQFRANYPSELSSTTVDNPPTVSITAPANGTTVTAGTTVVVNATASDTDSTPVANVKFSVDGVLKTTVTASPYTYSWDTTGLTGSHTISAVATDTASQASLPSTISVTVGGGTISSCNSAFPTDKFHVCFFGSMDPSTGAFIGERDEGTVTSPAPTSATPILHDYLTSGEFGKTDIFSGVWRGTFNFPSGNYIFTATGDDGLRLDIGDDGSYEINKWIDQGKTSYQTSPIALNGATKVHYEWYENQYDAYTSLGWSQVSANTVKIGDLNSDNLVNGADLAILLSRWGTTDVTADISKDGKVGSADLAILLAHWGS